MARILPIPVASRYCAALNYGIGHYDSLIVAAALQTGSVILYVEDMQHGQVVDGRSARWM